jgi:glyoxylase-like metal-dependent hydrolase (beta-lactamase superfamily II)
MRVMRTYEVLKKFGHPCEVDVTLAEGEKLESHPEWEVIYTPGHSQTQLSLYRAEDQTMLLADHLIAHISSNAFLEPTVRTEGDRIKPLIQYRNQLEKLRDIPIKTGLSGHGVPILDHVDLIGRRFESMERRADNIVKLLAEREMSVLELANKLFPKHNDQLPLILSETLGHLDWLEEEGRIRVERRDGIDRFSI